MAVVGPRRNRILAFIFATLVVALALYFFLYFEQDLRNYLASRMGSRARAEDSLINIPKLILFSLLAFLGVRALNTIIFDFVFRVRRGYEAPTLVRNIFSLVAFTVLFVLIFNRIYSEVNLGALFTTSAIFGVIIGLALQDTLGNFFSGISLHADRPFQVGDVIVVGQQKHTGVVEGITWRAIKIRTFQNHVVLVSNSNAAKEAIEVCPRDNLNARVDIVSPLSTEELQKLAAATVGHVVAPGETLIRAGDEGSSMFVVHNGRVQVQVTENGRPRPVAVLSEGDFFGEMALFTGEPRTANVLALEETEVLEIGHVAMKHLFETNPDLAESISWTIAERRASLAADAQQLAQASIEESAGLLSSIKRFFGLR